RLDQPTPTLADGRGFKLDLRRNRYTAAFRRGPIDRVQAIVLALAGQRVISIQRPLQRVQDGRLARLIFGPDYCQPLAAVRGEIQFEVTKQAEVFELGADELHRPSSLRFLGAPRFSATKRPAALHLSLIRCCTFVPCTRCWRSVVMISLITSIS